eukprot:COSAG01_NODE_48623_length_379_cov_1.103571_1_plen_65_part_01
MSFTVPNAASIKRATRQLDKLKAKRLKVNELTEFEDLDEDKKTVEPSDPNREFVRFTNPLAGIAE